MAIYKKSVSIGGDWLKGSEIIATKAKIVSETEAIPSSFLNKDGTSKNQDVCKVILPGNPNPYNLSLNKATINGLVDAFGEDSKNWMGKVLVIETEKVKVAGKTVTAVYLIPEGYKKMDDVNGYTVIVKADVGTSNSFETSLNNTVEPMEVGVDEVNVEDIPF